MLKISHVTRRFGDKVAVNDVTLEIPQGQMVGIIGRSGAGKSTLLRMINRLNDVSSGYIEYDGVKTSALRGKALRAWQRDCAMIFQQFNLVPRLDVITNVMLGRLNGRNGLLNLLQLFTAEEQYEALQALERLDIAQTATQWAQTLSGGQQQRVAIARALAMQPIALLCDEITSALDPELVSEVLAVVRELAAEGMTLLMVTHEMKFARDVCSRVVFMHEGRVHEIGPPEEVFSNPTTPELKQFLGVAARH